jgi:hypothetical protein
MTNPGPIGEAQSLTVTPDPPQEWIPEQSPPPQTGPPAQGTPAGQVDAQAVQRMIQQALDAQQKQHDSDMDSLRSEVSASQTAAAANVRAAFGSQIAPHAAGPGDEIAPTWSQAEQEEMRRLDTENARELRNSEKEDAVPVTVADE